MPTLTDSRDIGYFASLCRGIDLPCPCGDTIDVGGALAAGGVCPSCEKPLAVTIIDGAVIPKWIAGLDEGYVKVESLPELPDKRRERFVDEYTVTTEMAAKLTTTRALADFFEQVTETVDEASPPTAATLTADELLGELKYRDLEIDVVDSTSFAPVVDAYATEAITDASVTRVIRETLDTDTTFTEAVAAEEDRRVADDDLDEIVAEVIDAESDAVGDYQSGETSAIDYLVGQVMQRTEGGADAQMARQKLTQQLE